MKIKIINIQNDKKINQSHIRALVNRTVKLYTREKYDINIIFVDELYIKNMKNKYFNMNRVTDVIAFGMNEGKYLIGENRFLGDVFVCPNQAYKRARDFGNSFGKELCLYVIHGVLHLLQAQGFIKSGHRILERLQEEVYAKLYS